jgi:predicted amidophosphoribosyltransferase
VPHDDRVLDLVLPRRCAVCLRLGEPLCGRCDTRLVRLRPPLCERCGSPGAWPVRRCVECAGRRIRFSSARAALLYDTPARALVLAWKERGRRDLTGLLARLVDTVVAAPEAEAVTFVPGDRDRVLKRGHSPPERLAWELASLWRLPLQPLLLRSQHAPQRGLSLPDRLSNVAGGYTAFGAVPRRVVLVDDVYTTGSTVNACATALRRSGADRVDVVCVARVVR